MPAYKTLNKEIEDALRQKASAAALSPYATGNEDARRRRDSERDRPSAWRTAFLRDIDKIMHCPFYNRYADKTQVFSLFKNDDLSRRALHVQLVSRIARTIGAALSLNLDLIEAIALGHDIGHTPFGHMGEKVLDELYAKHTGRHFSHNIQSVRVLDAIFPYNITLETLAGIAGHNGESEKNEYRPHPLTDFSEFDTLIEHTYAVERGGDRFFPSTLEGCVVRIADIIAYLGKDRQDAARAGLLPEDAFVPTAIGRHNAEIINNMIVNIIENSYNKPCICMDGEHFDAIAEAKRENYEKIYFSDTAQRVKGTVYAMMSQVYERLLEDLLKGRRDSKIFSHHIAYIGRAHYERRTPYEETEPNLIVVDYIASMTDDYLVDLHRHLFPRSRLSAAYHGYFD